MGKLSNASFAALFCVSAVSLPNALTAQVVDGATTSPAFKGRVIQCWNAFYDASSPTNTNFANWIANVEAGWQEWEGDAIASVAELCQDWASGLPQNFSCQLRDEEGQVLNTTCRRYYFVREGSRYREISDIEYLDLLLDAEGVEIGTYDEELPAAYDARIEAAAEQEELVQRIAEFEGQWCSHNGRLQWQCDRSFGCLRFVDTIPPDAQNQEIDWQLNGAEVTYVQLYENDMNTFSALRMCSVMNTGNGYTLSCNITTQLLNSAPQTTNEVVELSRSCDG